MRLATNAYPEANGRMLIAVIYRSRENRLSTTRKALSARNAPLGKYQDPLKIRYN